MTKIEVQLEDQLALPESIKILHKVFDLRERQYHESFGNHRLAEINFLAEEINYLPVAKTETVDSIIHEVLHGLFAMFDLKMSDDQEEHVVSALATGLTTVMKDNPDLFPALQDMVDA